MVMFVHWKELQTSKQDEREKAKQEKRKKSRLLTVITNKYLVDFFQSRGLEYHWVNVYRWMERNLKKNCVQGSIIAN